MKRVVLLATLALAVVVPTAQAQTTIIEPMGSHFPYQRWIDESQVPTPDVTLEVIEEAAGDGCPFVPRINACTVLTEDRVWIGATQLLGANPRETFMHEVAHYFSAYLMPGWARERFASLYGLGGPWEMTGSGEMTAEEWFAEVYAACSVKPYITKPEWAGTPVYGGRPPLGHRMVYNKACRMLRNL